MALAVLAVLGAHVSVARAGSVKPYVTTHGTHFVDRSGHVVLLRGVDMSYRSTQLGQAVAVGANFVRLRVLWSWMQPTAHGVDAGEIGALDRAVAYFSAHHITIELDLRGRLVPGWFGSTAGFYKANRAASQAAYRRFALAIVRRYDTDPWVVGYGIFNEPQPMSWNGGGLGSRLLDQRILRWQAGIRDAIRATDPNRVVFLNVRGGNYGMNACFRCAGFRIQHTVIDWHDFYNGCCGSGMDAGDDNWLPNWPQTHNQLSTNYRGTVANQWANLAIPLQRTHKLGIPMIVGEWGIRNDDTNAITYDTQMTTLFDRHGISWARWDMDGNSPLGLLDHNGLNTQGLWLQNHLRGPGTTTP